MFLPKEAIYRTLVGASLKSVGCTARILDVPSDVSELKKKAIQREAVLLSTMIVSSLLLEVLFKHMKPKKTGFPVLQFIPQILAYAFAEWLSRRTTGYTEVLHSTLINPSTKPSVGSVLKTSSSLPAQSVAAKIADYKPMPNRPPYYYTNYSMYSNSYYPIRPY
jgi:hypothetical protein